MLAMAHPLPLDQFEKWAAGLQRKTLAYSAEVAEFNSRLRHFNEQVSAARAVLADEGRRLVARGKNLDSDSASEPLTPESGILEPKGYGPL
jgi:hypothetical protein